MNEDKRNSVLIVDDENSGIMALTDILSPEYTVFAAKNGQNAVTAAEKHLPDVILLDILMPDMDGYAVIAELKNSEKTRNIPVIFITGLSDVGDEEKGLAMGASDYITKPFSPSIVKLRVRNQIVIINQIRLSFEKKLSETIGRVRIEFLSRMSHEMLTPMNAIMGMTQMAKMMGTSQEVRQLLEEIDAASRQLLGLINDLLDISGNKPSAFSLSNSVFSFEEMFRNVWKEMRPDIEEKRQTFTYDIDQSIPESLIGDEKRLAQVIINLLTNALKFTPEEGKIHLFSRVINEDNEIVTLQVEITDNGKGISKEQQRDIFNIFDKLDDSPSSEQSGAGLGLPISQRIIEKMGGKIWIESEPDKGSKFTFTCKMKKE